ncbi:hypothetical protein GCM10022224_064310 [Nonomuraea antimicrobica]|uniref:Uncharacterized protein n=1 Tax=Nonomuraea antimicrobica TaxID=561173 RepID=A0ABP7CJY5_9ACTN
MRHFVTVSPLGKGCSSTGADSLPTSKTSFRSTVVLPIGALVEITLYDEEEAGSVGTPFWGQRLDARECLWTTSPH